jgi:UDP-2-acetamido-2,6-beta-L-arabino-hexul-4-ose reductase
MSYLPPSELSRTLVRREDARGTLAEVLVSDQAGQVFVSRTRPGVTRGNHYHDLKVERFCVLEGEALIRLRPVGAGGVIEHRVRGVDFTTVDIPPGMTHSIENIGSGDLVVLFWASEVLDLRRPDTHPMDVLDD